MAAIMPDQLGAWSLTDDTMKRHGVGVGEARCLGKVNVGPPDSAGHRWPPTHTLIPVDDRQGHVSPKVAALATWPQAAEAQVVSIEVRGDRAELVIKTFPPHPDGYWVYCIRRHDGWHETVSGNGPIVGWDDPGVIEW